MKNIFKSIFICFFLSIIIVIIYPEKTRAFPITDPDPFPEPVSYTYEVTNYLYVDKICFNIYQKNGGEVDLDTYEATHCVWFRNTYYLNYTSDDARYFRYEYYYTSAGEDWHQENYTTYFNYNIDGIQKVVYLNIRENLPNGSYYVKTITTLEEIPTYYKNIRNNLGAIIITSDVQLYDHYYEDDRHFAQYRLLYITYQ